ncbi:flagellar protein FlaG [Pseudomonas fragi]|uniref:flagellar protein FlaG n=1 Tax=Pseudomonas fragi TaxID=296 RepID=UPI0014762532|nr:flagellar protein FlaG [Pseudomonas fragi]NNB08482.1 flagellar protein FlaG [Pseudomonas fragi]
MDISIKLNSVYPSAAGLASPAPAPVATTQAIAAPAPSTGMPPERAELEKAVSDIQEFAQSNQRKLDFSIDDTTGVMVVKVIAADSGEVIRQLPSEVALKLAQNLADPHSLLFQGKA